MTDGHAAAGGTSLVPATGDRDAGRYINIARDHGYVEE